MKQILCFFTVCLVSIRCQTGDEGVKVQQSTSISIVADVTDKKILWPLIAPILQLYHCKENPDAACQFTLTIISDKKLNPSFSYHLPDANKMEEENMNDDPQFRNKNIVTFYTLLRTCLDSFYRQFDTTKSFNNSECWTTICSQLRNLTEEKFNNKYLLVFSDLMEKSDVFDSYSSLLQEDPKVLAKRFTNMERLPASLKNVTVIFIYEPDTRKNDKTFNKMVFVYKKLLEERGSKVIIQATNTHYEL